MSNDKRPAPDQHRAQIAAYSSELENYARYAAVLKRVLEKACEQSVHEAVVQARAKTLASFAEKCVRKWQKHKNAAEEFTDLCGGRVIVQTLEQVKAVRAFVEANFVVVETEDEPAMRFAFSKRRASACAPQDRAVTVRKRSRDSTATSSSVTSSTWANWSTGAGMSSD